MNLHNLLQEHFLSAPGMQILFMLRNAFFVLLAISCPAAVLAAKFSDKYFFPYMARRVIFRTGLVALIACVFLQVGAWSATMGASERAWQVLRVISGPGAHVAAVTVNQLSDFVASVKNTSGETAQISLDEVFLLVKAQATIGGVPLELAISRTPIQHIRMTPLGRKPLNGGSHRLINAI